MEPLHDSALLSMGACWGAYRHTATRLMYLISMLNSSYQDQGDSTSSLLNADEGEGRKEGVARRLDIGGSPTFAGILTNLRGCI